MKTYFLSFRTYDHLQKFIDSDAYYNQKEVADQGMRAKDLRLDPVVILQLSDREKAKIVSFDPSIKFHDDIQFEPCLEF